MQKFAKTYHRYLISSLILGSISATAHARTARIPGDFGSIQEGIYFHGDYDTLLVAPGLYRGSNPHPGLGESYGNVDVDWGAWADGLVIRSEGGPEVTTIDAGGETGGLYIHDVGSTTRLEGFTLRGGTGNWFEECSNEHSWHDLPDYGGALIINNASPVIQNCVFVNNGKLDNLYGSAALIWNGQGDEPAKATAPSFNNCEFKLNYAGGAGGAVTVFDNTGDPSDAITPSFFNCRFEDNRANAFGGAIASWADRLTVIGSEFYFNGAHMDESTSMVSPNHPLCGVPPAASDESAPCHGGGVSIVSGEAIIIESSFGSNYASGNGGGIHAFGDLEAQVSAWRCNFSENRADSLGGDAYAGSGSLYLEDCSMRSSQAFSGGSIAVQSFGDIPVSLAIDGTSFYQTLSTSRPGGAGVLIDGRDNGLASASISNSEFNSCSTEAFSSGGSVHVRTAMADLDNCRFLNNAAQRGAGVYVYNGDVSLKNGFFSGNQSQESGAGFYSILANGSLDNCEFLSNVDFGPYGGGAIYAFDSGTELRGCILSDNQTGGDGGAVFSSGNGQFSAQNCNFKDNQADNNSDGLWFGDNFETKLENCIVWETGTGTPIVGDADVTYSNVRGGHPGTGNINANPGWISRLGYDYVLPANSASMDAGTGEEDGLTWTAINSNYGQRNTATPDMGAYGGPTVVGWMSGAHGRSAWGEGLSAGDPANVTGSPYLGKVPSNWQDYSVRIDVGGYLNITLGSVILSDERGIDLYVEEVDAEDGFSTDSYEVFVSLNAQDWTSLGTASGDATFDLRSKAKEADYIRIEPLGTDVVEIDAVSLIHYDADWIR